jgi:hypothetical protein
MRKVERQKEKLSLRGVASSRERELKVRAARGWFDIFR